MSLRRRRIERLWVVGALPGILLSLPGAAQRPADFDGDGREDLVIGTPRDQVGEIDQAGSVNLLYGARRGLATRRNKRWSQDSAEVAGDAGYGDRFGDAHAAGDFNGDGYSDLAVGAWEDLVDTESDAGAVNVLYGGPRGVTAFGNQLLDMDIPDNWRGVEEAWFGFAVTSGDFNGDGFDDLAVGAPRMRFYHYTLNSGQIFTFYGSPDGLRPGNMWAQEDASTGDSGEGDCFGWALAAADFDGDGCDDLAVSAPYKDDIGGTVSIIYGTRDGLTYRGSQTWFDANLGGYYTSGTSFGKSLAVGHINGDRFADLAIAAPGRNYLDGREWESRSGAVVVLYGSRYGLTDFASENIYRSSGLPGSPIEEERVGETIALGDFDGNGYDDLAIGVPCQDVSEQQDAGAVIILPAGRNGLQPRNARVIHQDRGGVPGAPEEGDQFGSMLTARDFNGDGRDDLAVGVPNEDHGGFENAGIVHVFYGSSRGVRIKKGDVWHQDVERVRGEAGEDDRFGAGLEHGSPL